MTRTQQTALAAGALAMGARSCRAAFAAATDGFQRQVVVITGGSRGSGSCSPDSSPMKAHM